MLQKWPKVLLFLVITIVANLASESAFAQAPMPTPESTLRYIDPVGGLTADRAVTLALENNGEILALRREVDAARALVKQAGLRANPTLNAAGAKQINGPDNNQMAELMLPLELGGRRAARVAVARRELEIRELALSNQERLLAAEVRLKFAEALAAIKRLEVTEKALAAARQGYELVAARVADGKTAPLEQSVLLVEVNRLQSIRETAEGKVEIGMLELRNIIGSRPEEPMRLRDEFRALIAPLQPLAESTSNALRDRPDLQGARAAEELASANIERARSEGRLDASIKGGYQRMKTGFPLSGFDDNGVLRPIDDTFRFFTFGVEIMLPVRNRNQGAVEAAVFDREGSARRVEFGELTIRREVASAFSRYTRAARSLSIMQNGVRDQAEANLQVIWQTYELGSRSLLDYINEMRRFLEVENELIDAQLETYSASIEFLRATNAPELK